MYTVARVSRRLVTDEDGDHKYIIFRQTGCVFDGRTTVHEHA